MDDRCEKLRSTAMMGYANGTEAINAYIAIAAVATSKQGDFCCLETLLDVLEQQSGLSGTSLVGTSEPQRKTFEVERYIKCLLEQARQSSTQGS